MRFRTPTAAALAALASLAAGAMSAMATPPLSECDIVGTDGDDVLWGTSESVEVICGLGGNDELYAVGVPGDTLYGGPGDDRLCGSGGSETGGSGGSGGSSGAAGAATGGSSGTGGTTDAGPDDAASDATIDVGPVSSCDELSTIACFANNECEATDRCENMGTDDEQVPCCVAGTRGTGQAGETCVDENDCESAVCIAGNGPYMCSKTCTTADDCPDGMKDYTYIAFSGSNDMWCLPTD